MGEAKYLFAIAAIRCLTKEDPGELIDQNSYHQCMCDAGVTSYCSRVGGTSTVRPSFQPTQDPRPLINPYDNRNSIFKKIDTDVHQPQLHRNSGDNWEAATTQLDSGMMWVGLLTILLCIIYIMYRCKCNGDVADGASQAANGRRRRSSARPAEETGSCAAATNSGGGGGGGGGGPSETPADPADLPPPYDLVYETDAEPPSYETAIEEEAKIGSNVAV